MRLCSKSASCNWKHSCFYSRSLFLKKAAVILAIHGQKNYTEVKLYSLVYTTVILRQ